MNLRKRANLMEKVNCIKAFWNKNVLRVFFFKFETEGLLLIAKVMSSKVLEELL